MFGIDDKLGKFADNLERRSEVRAGMARKFANSDNDIWIVQMVTCYVVSDIARAIKDTLE
jgi:hypothetical protein